MPSQTPQVPAVVPPPSPPLLRGAGETAPATAAVATGVPPPPLPTGETAPAAAAVATGDPPPPAPLPCGAGETSGARGEIWGMDLCALVTQHMASSSVDHKKTKYRVSTRARALSLAISYTERRQPLLL